MDDQDSQKFETFTIRDRKTRLSLIEHCTLTGKERSAFISDVTFMPMSEVYERLPRA